MNTDFRRILIPGPAQGILAEALELDPEASLYEMVQAIERLQAQAKKKTRKEKSAVIPIEEKRAAKAAMTKDDDRSGS